MSAAVRDAVLARSTSIAAYWSTHYVVSAWGVAG